jgi:hypothetical protein
MQFFTTNFPTLSIWSDEAHLIGDSALTGQMYTNINVSGGGEQLDWWVAVNRAVKDRVVYAAFGAYVNEYLMWFNPGDPTSVDCCMFDSDIEINGWEASRGIKLKSVAYLAMEDMLSGSIGICMTNDASTVLVAWSKGGQSTLCFWVAERNPPVDTHLSYATDVFGSSVPPVGTQMPIFWTTNAIPGVALSNAWVSIHAP